MPRSDKAVDILDEAVRDVEIIALVRAGVSHDLIAEEHRIGVRKVRAIAERHVRDIVITRRAKRGESYAAIGDDYDITAARAREIAVANGVPNRLLGYNPITIVEAVCILNLAPTHTIDDLAAVTQRSDSAIRALLKKHDAKAKPPPNAPWPDEAIKRLKDLWPTTKAHVIGRDPKIKRTRNAVIGMAHRLGLPKKTRHGKCL